MRAARGAMNAAQRAGASAAICARLMEMLNLHADSAPGRVAVYLGTAEEANIDAVAHWLMEQSVPVVAPRTAAVLPFYDLRSLREGVGEGVAVRAFGVREPEEFPGGKAWRPEDVSLILVPGLAFDQSGGRLGFGGGWYDRVLAHAPLSVGVCFDCQIVEYVPREAHDQPVAAVVTETRTIDVTGRFALNLTSS